MDPERWQQFKDLLNEALDWPEAERAARLEEFCGDDEELRREVASLINWANGNNSFLEHGPNPVCLDATNAITFGPAAGSDVGPYRIEREIGQGGMGRVFLAEDRRLNRRVAIKVLNAGAPSGSDRTLILREARAIARLSHPNIAAVHDVVEQDGRTHIVMEFLEGETLAARLAHGPMSIDEVFTLSTQMAAGLGHAHKHGLVHCDFKPANVFITRDGVAKLLDFGLARLVHTGTADESEHLGASPTLIRQRAGTPGYMSPEHMKGEPLDARSDVYSFGIVLYEMASSRRHGTGTTVLLEPSVPPVLRPIVAKSLAMNREDRFQSAAELETELRAAARRAESPFRFLSTPRALATAAAVVLLAGLAAVWGLRGPGSAAPATSRAVVAVLPFATPDGDSTAKYLAAGLTEIVTNDISTSKDLVVVSNNSVRNAVNDDRGIEATAAELGATYVVAGSLRTAGPRLNVDLRVFSAASKTYTPASSASIAFADVVGKPRSMAGAIRARLREAGLPVEGDAASTSSTSNQLALEEYARGREYLDRFDAGDNLDIALKLLSSALERDESFALAHAALSEGYWRKYRRTREAGWATRAQAEAFEAMRLAPAEPAVRYSAAVVLQGTGKSREALDEVTKVIALQPNNDEAHRLLAQLYTDSGNLDQAIPEFQAAIELRPGSWENYHALGLAYFNKSRYQEAIAAFTRETELRPDNAAPFQALGTSYHALGDVDRALANYQRALSIAPNAFAYSNIGSIHYSKGRYAEAVAAYEQSAKIAPREPVTHRNLADSLVKAGDSTRARASYRQAIALADDQLRLNPTRARLVTLQAVCHAKLQERAAARKAVDAALAIAPPDSGVLFQAAVALALIGEADRSVALIKQAVAAGYSLELIRDEEDFSTLRSRPDFQAIITAAAKK